MCKNLCLFWASVISFCALSHPNSRQGVRGHLCRVSNQRKRSGKKTKKKSKRPPFLSLDCYGVVVVLQTMFRVLLCSADSFTTSNRLVNVGHAGSFLFFFSLSFSLHPLCISRQRKEVKKKKKKRRLLNARLFAILLLFSMFV